MTPVTRLGRTVAAATLVAGLGSGVLGDLLGGLLGGPPDQEPARDRSSYGHTSAPDGVLRAGCHGYRYRYRVTAPSDDWTLETFLRDPTGDSLASGGFMSDSDPRRGTGSFRFCRYATRPGKFTIRAKLHWYGPYGEDHKVRLEPSHFHLRRPR